MGHCRLCIRWKAWQCHTSHINVGVYAHLPSLSRWARELEYQYMYRVCNACPVRWLSFLQPHRSLSQPLGRYLFPVSTRVGSWVELSGWSRGEAVADLNINRFNIYGSNFLDATNAFTTIGLSTTRHIAGG